MISHREAGLLGLVRHKLENNKETAKEEIQLSGHDLYQLNLNPNHNRAQCELCSKETAAAGTKKFYIVKLADGSFFKRINGDLKIHTKTNSILLATPFTEKLFETIDTLSKTHQIYQVFGDNAEIIEVKLAYTTKRIRMI